MGLPIRRPRGRAKNFVLAYSDEIDAWMDSHFEAESPTDLDVLRQKLAKVEKENELLREQLRRAAATATFIQWNGFPDIEDWMDGVLLRRCSHAVQKNTALRQQSLHVLDETRNMRELRRAQKVQKESHFQSFLIQ